MKILPTLLCLPILCASASCLASSLDGVWQGSLGSYPVTLCFQEQHDGESVGMYFYDKHKKLIRLTHKNGRYEEEGGSGFWQGLRRQGQQLEGEWRAKNGNTLRLKLQSVPALSKGEEDYPACASRAFHAKLEQALQVLKGEEKQIHGKRYRLWHARLPGTGEDLALSRIELLENGPGIMRINQTWSGEFLSSGQESALTECRRHALRAAAYEGSYTRRQEIIFWRAPYLTKKTGEDGDCGGAHPFNGIAYTVWNTESGQQVDPWQWFKGLESRDQKIRYSAVPPARLHKMVVSHFLKALGKDQQDCAELLREQKELLIWLSPNGFSFASSMPRVAQACDQETELSPAQVAEFLNERGKQVMHSLFK